MLTWHHAPLSQLFIIAWVTIHIVHAIIIMCIYILQATAIIESARNEGLGLLYERLNITDPRHKASLDYLRTLRQSSERVRLHVGFNTAVSGPYNGDNTN